MCRTHYVHVESRQRRCGMRLALDEHHCVRSRCDSVYRVLSKSAQRAFPFTSRECNAAHVVEARSLAKRCDTRIVLPLCSFLCFHSSSPSCLTCPTPPEVGNKKAINCCALFAVLTSATRRAEAAVVSGPSPRAHPERITRLLASSASFMNWLKFNHETRRCWRRRLLKCDPFRGVREIMTFLLSPCKRSAARVRRWTEQPLALSDCARQRR